MARCKFKASGVKFVGILTTRIYHQLKNLMNMFKDLIYESTLRKFSAPAINSVIFMAQRPNIAVLIVRAKFTRILSDSVKCWRLLGNEDMVGSKINSNLGECLAFDTLKLASPYSYIWNFYDTKTIGYFAHLTLGVGFKVIFVAFSWIWADCRGSGTHEDNWIWQRLTFKTCL